ncbi:MAG TPA: hypothetical protein VG734_26205 [Lacunisphaera sp.]|nr:hypothetical protein [Lacunisphaera sp.]
MSLFDGVPVLSPVVAAPPAPAVPKAYAEQHVIALRDPRPGYERALVSIFRGMAEYADAYRKEYESAVCDDGYCGPFWQSLGEALLGLLSSDIGRIDPGTFDHHVRALLEGEGSAESVAAAAEVLRPEPVAPAADASGEIGKRRLTHRQRELLACVRVEDNFAVYAREERIPDWNELKTTMLALGGKWKTASKKRPGGFEFADDADAAELVRLALESGEIFDPKAADFFWTNDELADELAAFVDPRPGDFVLEPSAGKGALAKAILRACPKAYLVCIEPFPPNRVELKKLGFEIGGDDFLTIAGPEEFACEFSGVIMNPPFGGRADIRHITHALKFLRSGGRLAAIASAGVKYRQDRLATEFRALIAKHGGEIVDNPAGSFAAAGTGVSTVTVRLRKAEVPCG